MKLGTKHDGVLEEEHFNHPKGMFRAAPSGNAFGLLTGRVLLETTYCHRCATTFNAISFGIKIISILWSHRKLRLPVYAGKTRRLGKKKERKREIECVCEVEGRRKIVHWQ